MIDHTGNPGDSAPVPPERTGDSTEDRTEVSEARYPICPECHANLYPTPLRYGALAWDNYPGMCPECGLVFSPSSAAEKGGAASKARMQRKAARLALNAMLAHHDEPNTCTSCSKWVETIMEAIR